LDWEKSQHSLQQVSGQETKTKTYFLVFFNFVILYDLIYNLPISIIL